MIRCLIDMPSLPKSMFIAWNREASKLYQISAASMPKSPFPPPPKKEETEPDM